MKKKIILSIIISVMVLSLSAFGVYAYFHYSTNSPVNITTDINEDTVIEIDSFKNLFKYSKAETYDDREIVSNKTSRKILKLTEDIMLNDDLYVTADVHIDLNGHKIDLNDHVISFKHGYAGAFNFYNGTIEVKEEGYLSIDLVNATFIENDLSFTKEGVSIDSSDYIKIVNLNAKYTAYSALYYAINNIQSSLKARMPFVDYEKVIPDSFVLSSDKFIRVKECEYPGTAEACAFVYKDLDLKENYLSSDIVISYSSDNIEILSNKGDFTAPTKEEDITLTINVYSESLSIDESIDLTLHAVNLDDSETKNKVSEILIKEYLNTYYIDRPLGDMFNDYYYYFSNSVELPIEAFDGLITYSYETLDLLNNNVETTSKVKNDVYLFEPNEDCGYLLITLNETNPPLKLNMYSTSIGNYEALAWVIVNELYGGSIIFDSSSTKRDLYTFDDIRTNPFTKNYVNEFNVTGVSYEIKNPSDALNYYTLTDNSIYIKDGEIPMVKAPYITMTLSFLNDEGETDYISIDLYIQYLDASGDSLSNFIPYYSAYDPMVVTDLISSFEMPFAYDKGTPYTCFDFFMTYNKATKTLGGDEVMYFDYSSFGIPESLSVSLYYNGSKRLTFNYSSNESITKELDQYLSSNSLKLSDIAQYEDAKYIIEIDPTKVLNEDTEVYIVYNYKFANSGDWSRYAYVYDDVVYQTEVTLSKFIVSGGLFYDSTASSLKENAIYDANFFAWIYNNFKPSGDAISASDASTLIVPMMWLNQEIEMDVSRDSTLNSVSNFHGIGNLKKVSKIDLSGKAVSATVIEGISTLESLRTLNLVGCGLTDINSFNNLTSVKSLDISNNDIQYFDSLVSIRSLEEVYLYNNNETNKYYGSQGICNSQAFVDLMRNGTSVYNAVSNDIPVLFAESDSIDDYKRLKEIAYQDKLSENVSIVNLYSSFSTTYSDYNLSTNGTLTWGYEGDSNDPSGASGTTVYDASYFYVKYVFNGYTLVVKYYVDRY